MNTSTSMTEPAGAEVTLAALASRADVAAEFYLSLANAFHIPRKPEFVRALRDDLGADFAAIAEELGRRDLQPAIRELCDRLAEVGDEPRPLLQAYSALFLTPPLRAPLHAGMYRDGAPMGPTTLELERCYYHYGLDRARTFTSMPDHLVLLLEFTAFLHFEVASAWDAGDPDLAQRRLREAHTFLQRYVGTWTGDWLVRMEEADVEFEQAAVYCRLGHVLDAAVRGEIERMASCLQTEQSAGEETARSSGGVDGPDPAPQAVAVTCRDCGQPLTLEGDFAIIHQRLEQAGLSASHLTICGDCRTDRRARGGGMQALKPVRVPGAVKR